MGKDMGETYSKIREGLEALPDAELLAILIESLGNLRNALIELKNMGQQIHPPLGLEEIGKIIMAYVATQKIYESETANNRHRLSERDRSHFISQIIDVGESCDEVKSTVEYLKVSNGLNSAGRRDSPQNVR